MKTFPSSFISMLIMPSFCFFCFQLSTVSWLQNSCPRPPSICPMDISDSLGLIIKSAFFLHLKAPTLFLKFVLSTYSVSCSVIDHLPSAYQFLNPTDCLSCLLSVHLLLSILIAVTIVRYCSPSSLLHLWLHISSIRLGHAATLLGHR